MIKQNLTCIHRPEGGEAGLERMAHKISLIVESRHSRCSSSAIKAPHRETEEEPYELGTELQITKLCSSCRDVRRFIRLDMQYAIGDDLIRVCESDITPHGFDELYGLFQYPITELSSGGCINLSNGGYRLH